MNINAFEMIINSFVYQKFEKKQTKKTNKTWKFLFFYFFLDCQLWPKAKSSAFFNAAYS